MINVPSTLTPEFLIPFSVELSNVHIQDEYQFNFKNIGHVEPFGMLFLSALIRQFIKNRRDKQGRDLRISAVNYTQNEYASWMGFFKSFGLNHGNEPGEANGSSNYIPLTRLVVNKIKSEAHENFVHHGEIIEKESSRIATILTRQSDCELTETLTYAIREIMRNVVEHGRASHIWYAAQHWQTKNKVEISILDEGIGLFESLSRNEKLIIKDNQQALFLALQPGISGVSKNKRKKSDGDWVNSGYGLFMTSTLCQLGGSFYICSNGNSLQLFNNEAKFFPCHYEGVAIRMVLDTTKISNLNSLLSEIRYKGEKIAKELKNANTDIELTASKMSRMLLNKT